MITYFRLPIPQKALSSGASGSDSLTAVDERRLARLGREPRSVSNEAGEPVRLMVSRPRRTLWLDFFFSETPGTGLTDAGEVVSVSSFAGGAGPTEAC